MYSVHLQERPKYLLFTARKGPPLAEALATNHVQEPLFYLETPSRRSTRYNETLTWARVRKLHHLSADRLLLAISHESGVHVIYKSI